MRAKAMVGVMTRNIGLALIVSMFLAACASNDPAPGSIAATSDLTRALIDAATTALRRGDAATAVAYYRDACRRDPGNAAGTIGLMRSLRIAGGLDEARGIAAQAIVRWSSNAAVLAEAGKVRLAAGNASAAVPLLQRATAIDDHDWRTRSALGLAYDRLGRYPRAAASYKAALALSPDNAVVLNNFALSKAMAGDLRRARALAERAVEADGADLRVRQNLALIYALSGNISRATALTRRDLPAPLARATLSYFHRLAAATSGANSAGAPTQP